MGKEWFHILLARDEIDGILTPVLPRSLHNPVWDVLITLPHILQPDALLAQATLAESLDGGKGALRLRDNVRAKQDIGLFFRQVTGFRGIRHGGRDDPGVLESPMVQDLMGNNDPGIGPVDQGFQ